MLRRPSRTFAICFIFFTSAAFTSSSGWTVGYPMFVALRGWVGAQGSDHMKPIRIKNPDGYGITSYKLQLTYDPAVVQFASPPFDAMRTFSEGMDEIVANTDYPGHLIITAYNDVPITGNGTTEDGTLLNLKFRIVGTPGQSTLLKLEDWTSPANETFVGFIFNDGNPTYSYFGHGRVTVSTNSVSVSLPDVNVAPGTGITIPITTGNLTSLGVCCYEFQVTYDPAVIQPAFPPIDKAGTLSGNFTFAWNTGNPGHLIVNAFGPVLAGSGTLVNLRFTVVGPHGQSSPLIFEDYQAPSINDSHPGFMFNEGQPGGTTTNGSVTVGGATPTASPTTTATSQATPTASPALPIAVSLPHVNAAPGSIIAVPINITDVTGFEAIAYDSHVTFNPTVVQPASPAFELTGTVGERMGVFPNVSHPGHLIIPAYQHPPALAGAGVLVYLRFIVVGTEGQSTALRFENWTLSNNFFPAFMFNEGDPSSMTTNGSVTVADSAISGTAVYGNLNGTSGFVPNVMISGAGSVAGLAMTGSPDGVYLYSGFGAGSYVVTPSKTGGVNGSISSFDAAKIAQHVAGTIPLTGNQLIVADVSANGMLSSFDAGQIALYVAEITGSGSTGNWIFSPVSRSYASVSSIITGEDYSALLMGEVSGDWSNSSTRPAFATGPRRGATVELPQMVMPVGKDVVVPVNVRGVANKGVISYEFDLRYDPSVIEPLANPIDVTGTVSRGLSVVTNASEPGLLRVVVYGPMPIDGNGILLNLRFMAVGKPGSVSPLTWERFMFNEGLPMTATDGRVELF